jgi:hypothetical protein
MTLVIDESLKKLRLDRRLADRPGWATKEELDQAMAVLPDVSDKIAPAEEPPPAGAPETQGAR